MERIHNNEFLGILIRSGQELMQWIRRKGIVEEIFGNGNSTPQLVEEYEYILSNISLRMEFYEQIAQRYEQNNATPAA